MGSVGPAAVLKCGARSHHGAGADGFAVSERGGGHVAKRAGAAHGTRALGHMREWRVAGSGWSRRHCVSTAVYRGFKRKADPVLGCNIIVVPKLH